MDAARKYQIFLNYCFTEIDKTNKFVIVLHLYIYIFIIISNCYNSQ